MLSIFTNFSNIFTGSTKQLMIHGKSIKSSTYHQKKFLNTVSNQSSTVSNFGNIFLYTYIMITINACKRKHHLFVKQVKKKPVKIILASIKFIDVK